MAPIILPSLVFAYSYQPIMYLPFILFVSNFVIVFFFFISRVTYCQLELN